MVIHRLLSRVLALTALVVPFVADAALTVKPITWEVIGLDSNKPATGPQDFPFGARVCNDDTASAVGPVTVRMDLLDGLRPENINFVTGAAFDEVVLPVIPKGDVDNGSGPGCADAYFTLRVNKVAAAYRATRRFSFTVTGAGTASFPLATEIRQLYVEYLVSQNRNSVSSVQLGTAAPVFAGQPLDVVVGQTYTLTLRGKTATNGYEQLEAFLNLPNTLFQVEKVRTVFSADTSPTVGDPVSPPAPEPAFINQLYGDACRWENNAANANYKNCLGVGKVGGTFEVTYNLKVIGGGGTTHNMQALIYDFSGSSYHYNSDFRAFNIPVRIKSAPNVTFRKLFSPSEVSQNGFSTLRFEITNNDTAPVTTASFTDQLPGTTGSNFVSVTDVPAITNFEGCGSTPAFSIGGSNPQTLSFVGGPIPAGGTCVASIRVQAPGNPGNYVNVTGPLQIDGLDTSLTATDTLTVSNSPPAAPPRLSKGFSPNPVFAGTPSTLTFTLFNDNESQQLLGVAFSDTYPVGLSNVTTTVSGNTCGPTTPLASVNADGTVDVTVAGVTLAARGTGATPAAGSSCTFSVQVAAATGGNFVNVVNNVTSTTSGVTPGDPSSATLTVTEPSVSKNFTPALIAKDGITRLTVTISNPSAVQLTGLAFTDNFLVDGVTGLDTGLRVASVPGSSNTCGGTLSASAGATQISLANGTLSPGASCVVAVDVTATKIPDTNNQLTNTTGPVSYTGAGGSPRVAGPATAILTVEPPTPRINLKKFVATSNLGPWLDAVAVNVSPPNTPPAKVFYRFVVENIGNVPLSNIRIVDPAFSPLVPDPSPPPGSPCVDDLSVVSLAVGNPLENPASSVCFVTAGVTALPGQQLNVARAEADGGGGSGKAISLPDEAEYFGVLQALTLFKEVGTSPSGPWSTDLLIPLSASNVYYRFTVVNSGNAAINTVTVIDDDGSINPLVQAQCGALSPLQAGEARRCVVGPVTRVPTGEFVNTATASATGVAPSTSSAKYTVASANKVANLRVVKTVSPATAVAPGSVLTYTITVENPADQPSDASGARVVDKDPEGFTASSAPNALRCSSSPGAACPTTLSVSLLQGGGLTIPSLPSGSSVTFELDGTVDVGYTGGSITNTATVALPADVFDPDLTDNVDSAYTIVTTQQERADLKVEKFAINLTGEIISSIGRGQDFRYKITVTNEPANSNASVSGAVLRDLFPLTNVTLGDTITCVPRSSTDLCTQLAGQLTKGQLANGITIPNFPVGGKFDLIITATAGLDGVLINNATIVAPNGPIDPDPTNNLAYAVTPITGGSLTKVDLAVVKQGPSSIASDGTLRFTILVKNMQKEGEPAVAIPAGAKLYDRVVTGTLGTDPQVQCSTIPPTAMVCPDTSNAWIAMTTSFDGGFALPAFPAPSDLETSALLFTVTGKAGPGGFVFNTASVSPPSGTYDSDPRDNSSSASTLVFSNGPGVDLEVLKLGPSSVVLGASPVSIEYTIVVRNKSSTIAANGALLVDPAVANFTATNVSCGKDGNLFGGSLCPQNLLGATPSQRVVLLQSGIEIPLLPPQSSMEFVVTGTPIAAGTIENVARIFAPPGLSDPNDTNNVSKKETTVTGGGGSGIGTISGFVWYDTNGNNAKDSNEPPRGGWKVELALGGTVVATTLTLPDGRYTFTNLPPGGPYDVRFAPLTTPPRTAIPGGGPYNGDGIKGGTPTNMELRGISLSAGDVLVNQSLPIDPSGVVYDATARIPVAGATVTLLFNGSPANPLYIVGGSNTDVTAAGGQYAFFLMPGAPSGTWGLRVDPTDSYEGTASILIPPTPAPASIGGSIGTVGAPPVGAVTTYYLAFPLPSSDVTNNNIPLDPGKRIPAVSPALLALLALLLAGMARWAPLRRRDPA